MNSKNDKFVSTVTMAKFKTQFAFCTIHCRICLFCFFICVTNLELKFCDILDLSIMYAQTFFVFFKTFYVMFFWVGAPGEPGYVLPSGDRGDRSRRPTCGLVGLANSCKPLQFFQPATLGIAIYKCRAGRQILYAHCFCFFSYSFSLRVFLSFSFRKI